MEATERAVLRIPRVAELRADPGGFATWLLPLLLIVYLAMNNGGYDEIPRDQVGVAVWWLVLIGTAIGLLPAAGGTRIGRLMLGALALFAGWTALSLTWTDSVGLSSVELARVSTYLGVFALALAVQGEGRWRHLLNGVTTGVAIVCGIAVLSRLEPTWFSQTNAGAVLPGIEIERRLSYPLNYSSGLGAFAAISLPLLLAATASARNIVVQALAAAALPVVALALWLTTSSLAVPAAAVALVAFLILAPDRLPKLATLLVAGAGSAILIAAENQREALDRGIPTPTAQHQGDELLTILIVVCLGVALVQTAISLVSQYAERPPWTRPTPRQLARPAIAAACAVLLVGLAAGGGGKLQDEWHNFKYGNQGNLTDQSRGNQITDFSSSGRYSFWSGAVDAFQSAPLVGIGPGTFQFWWAQHGDTAGFVRDAHSLYLETLGELGIVGFILIAGFSLAVLLLGTSRALRGPPELRLGVAAATAGCAAFVATALVDWGWEVGVIPFVFLALAAVAVAGGLEAETTRQRNSGRTIGPRSPLARVATVALSMSALVAICLPLVSASALQSSRHAATAGDLSGALSDAKRAADFEPGAAEPRLQEALVQEQQGDFAAAVKSARIATDKEPSNWQNWIILSRLEARSGNPAASIEAYKTARSLNPRSQIFK
jgi:O-antigen ligase/polysaccharide polymerase Wzy-like membrane protein